MGAAPPVTVLSHSACACAAADAMAFDVTQPCECHAATANEILRTQSNDLLYQSLTCLVLGTPAQHPLNPCMHSCMKCVQPGDPT